MEYTKKYHLPQWKKEDRVMMEDFNAAMAEIEAGLSDAKEEAVTKPYVVGRYGGTGIIEQDIYVGFKPSVLIIFADQSGNNVNNTYGCIGIFSEDITSADTITMTETGFHVHAYNSSLPFPKMNFFAHYTYIAFR